MEKTYKYINLLPNNLLNGLMPYLSSKAIFLHYYGHHVQYEIKLLSLLNEHEITPPISLENIISETKNEKILNNALQIYNHNFYWKCLGFNEENLKIKNLFNSLGILNEFKNIANNMFGSGWVWITYNKQNKSLNVEKTSNANRPENTPLLVIDLWEHSYYINYENLRSNFINDFINHLINWNFVQEQLKLVNYFDNLKII